MAIAPNLPWRHARSSHNPVAPVRLMRKRSRVRRFAEAPALVPQRQRRTIVVHSCHPCVGAEQLVRKVPQALRGFFNGFVGLIMRKRGVFR